MISASRLSRVLNCPGSETLPHVESVGDRALHGTMVHRYLELVALGQPQKAVEELPPDVLALCEGLDVESLPPLQSLSPEAAFAYDAATHTARFLGSGLGRRYEACSLGPFEIPGTADLVGVTDDLAGVWDFKTGRIREAAYHNAQLKLLALCVCLVHGKKRARGHLVYLHERRVWTDVAEWDLLELEAFAGQIAEAITGPRRETLAEGPWCEYCPAQWKCPAKMTLVSQLGGEQLATVADHGLTRDSFRVFWRKLQAGRAMLKRLEEVAFAYGQEEIERNGPIDMGDGRRLEMVVRPGNEKLDGAIAHRVLVELIGQEKAAEAVEYQVGKASIERVLKALRASGVEAPSMVRVLNEIRNAGGVSRYASTRKLEERGDSTGGKP